MDIEPQGVTEESHKSSTNPFKTHRPLAWGLQIVSDLKEIPSEYVHYTQKKSDDPEPVQKLFDVLDELVRKVKLIKVQPLSLTPEQERQFRSAEECVLCRKEYDDVDIRVRDHDHYTGEYRGSAHRTCNVNYTDQMGGDKFVLPVVAHNMRGYDG